MKYGDPIHKVLRLLESENINPGNLEIGQTVDVKVTDARNAEFLRSMTVGEFYPDGQVLLKDTFTQEVIILQFQYNTIGEGLLYTGESDFGVKYELVINRNKFSNESITKLTEAVDFAPDEIQTKQIAKIAYDLYKKMQNEFDDLSDEEFDDLKVIKKIENKYMDKLQSECKKIGMSINDDIAFELLEDVQGNASIQTFERRVDSINNKY